MADMQAELEAAAAKEMEEDQALAALGDEEEDEEDEDFGGDVDMGDDDDGDDDGDDDDDDNDEEEEEEEKPAKKSSKQAKQRSRMIVDEADESDDDGDDEEDSGKKKKKKKKGSKVDEEVDDSSDDDDSDLDTYEADGFLVDDVEMEEDVQQKKRKRLRKKAEGEEGTKSGDEEDGDEDGSDGEDGSDDEEERKRRRKRKREDYDLDVEDLQLVRENLGIADTRTRKTDSGLDKGNFKRLKKRRKHAEEVAEEEDRLARKLSAVEASAKRREAMVEDDNMGDFISSDEEDDLDQFTETGYGATQDQLEQAKAIFGDMSEYYDDYAAAEEQEGASQLVQDPSALEEAFATTKDEAIRDADVPERMYGKFLLASEAPSQEELENEARWVASRLPSSWKLMQYGQEAVMSKIANVLSFLRVDRMEVPFITQYRKDYYSPELDTSDLWKINELDDKWIVFSKRKKVLEDLFKTEETDLSSLLEYAENEQELADLHRSFLLHHPPSEEDETDELDDIMNMDEDKPKEKKRKRRRAGNPLYYHLKKEGLAEAAAKFGISAEQLGVNLIDNALTHAPEDLEEDPTDFAATFLSDKSPTIEYVVAACQHILAVEIACDPKIRQVVRNMFEEQATISTLPTKDGKLEIDERHFLRGVKRLKDKPVSELKDSNLFALILKGKQNGLLSYKVTLPEGHHESRVLPYLKEFYLSPNTSSVATAWNDVRTAVLQKALTRMLYPAMEKELVSKLTEIAQDHLLDVFAGRIRDIVQNGPYLSNPESDTSNIMAITWGSSKNEPVACCTIDEHGEVIDSTKLDFMYISQHTESAEARGMKQRNMTELFEFIVRTTPDVIVIAAESMESRRLESDLALITEQLKEELPYLPSLIYAPTMVANTCAHTAQCAAEFPDYTMNLKKLICLARYVFDPLSQMCMLFNRSDDISCLVGYLEPLASVVQTNRLVEVLSHVVVDAVNQVGVNINAMIECPHLFSSLQFVCGLGPRKAFALQNTLMLKKHVETRAELAELMGECVYRNCCGFIQIHGALDGNKLDQTRIHPEDYNFTTKMMNTVPVPEKDRAKIGDDELKWIRYIMQRRDLQERLDALDLETFAHEWQRAGKGNKLLTLYDIKSELCVPFADARRPFQPPNEEELFGLLTGETDATLAPGQMVSVRVTRVNPDKAITRLDSGVTGMISRYDVSDDMVESVDSVLQPGQNVVCRVKEVIKDRFLVHLTCRQSDLDNKSMGVEPIYDPHLLPDIDEEDEIKKRKKKKAAKQVRVITHPLFKNVTYQEAEDLLKEGSFGEAVFRPSSKGYEHLTLTYKFHEMIVHVDVREEDKPNRMELGKKLFIGDEQYEDLDEISARYLDPILANCDLMAAFRKFEPGKTEMEVEALVRQEKSQVPNGIPYKVAVSVKHPGRYVLLYIPNTSVRKEYISVTPDGFRFRSRVHKDVERLVAWFKRHWKDPIQPKRSSRSSSSHASSSQWGGRSQPSSSQSYGSGGGSYGSGGGGGSYGSGGGSYGSGGGSYGSGGGNTWRDNQGSSWQGRTPTPAAASYGAPQPAYGGGAYGSGSSGSRYGQQPAVPYNGGGGYAAPQGHGPPAQYGQPSYGGQGQQWPPQQQGWSQGHGQPSRR